MTRAHDNDFPGRASEIEQQAAEWVTRIDLRGTPEEWAALDAWLNASPRHRAAFLRLSVAWRRADALKGLAPLSGAVDEDLLDPIRSRDEFTEDELLEGRAVSLDAHRAGARAEAAMQVEPAEAHADHQSNARPAPARAFRVVANNENITPADMQWAQERVTMRLRSTPRIHLRAHRHHRPHGLACVRVLRRASLHRLRFSQ
jgi:hypothetical protein